jgi:outer membrane protein assembly factor BamB
MTRRAAAWALALALPLTVACGGSPESYTIAPETTGSFPDAESSASWEQWGGPNGDFKASVVSDLAESWPEQGPPQIWSRSLGSGYAAVVFRSGVLFTGYRDGDDDVFIALRADDGSTIWEHRYRSDPPQGSTLDFGTGPNATPLVLPDRVITLGFGGTLEALDAKAGQPIWSHELIADFGGNALDFGYSASPIHHDGNVIVLVGGDRNAVVAFDPDDGSVAWASDPGGVSYATPIVIDVDGQVQIVYFSHEEVIGIAADGGRRLWSFPVKNQYLNNATGPSWGDGNLLWVATQLDGGTRVLRLTREGDATKVEEVWSSNKMSIHFWNTLRFDGHVYASVGSNALIVVAIDVETGEIKWRQRGFEQANLVHAGDVTILLDSNGELALVKLSPEGMDVVSRVSLLDGESWTVPTLVDTTLYVRDTNSIRALDLGTLSFSASNEAEPGAEN